MGTIVDNSQDQTQESGGGILASTPEDEAPHFKESCFNIRAALECNKRETKGLMEHWGFEADENFKGQHGEMRANIMLAYRHLEDARMRLGKAVQAYDGGESCYPR